MKAIRKTMTPGIRSKLAELHVHLRTPGSQIKIVEEVRRTRKLPSVIRVR